MGRSSWMQAWPRAEPDASRRSSRRTVPEPQPDVAALLAVQRSAGNKATAALLARTVAPARLLQREPNEGDGTDDDLEPERAFVCERADSWNALLSQAGLWTVAGADEKQTSDLAVLKGKLSDLGRSVVQGEDLAERERLINDAEQTVEAWVAAHRGSNPAKADEVTKLKLHTLDYERRRLLKMKAIEDSYGIRISGARGVERARDSSTAEGNPVTLQRVAELAGKSLFNLEELDLLAEALGRYAPLLGGRRASGLGPQPLTHFARQQFGLTRGTDPGADEPLRTESESGGHVGETILIYGRARELVDFDTWQKNFRGTVEHELSHALIEPLRAGGHDTMLQKFRTDLGYWDIDDAASSHKAHSHGAAKMRAAQAGKEAPPTAYGLENVREDLAETMMLFFEDPATLEKQHPERYLWVRANLQDVLSPDYLASLPQLPESPASQEATGYEDVSADDLLADLMPDPADEIRDLLAALENQ
jgi:hypothetical protein